MILEREKSTQFRKMKLRLSQHQATLMQMFLLFSGMASFVVKLRSLIITMLLEYVGIYFEKKNDDEIWQTLSENVAVQKQNRKKIMEFSDFIIPGHGPEFKVER